MARLILVLLILLSPLSQSFADEVKYIYDDPGRLYQVIDSQGNVATYNYDAVGNLLSVTRSTGGIPAPQISAISPDNARAGDTVNVIISGNHLVGTGVSTNNTGINVSNVRATETSIAATFEISFFAPFGATTITVSNVLGSAQIGFIVNPPPPTINSLSPTSGPVTRLVEIKGTGFSNIPSGNQVKFDGVTATVYYATPFEILTSVPTGATTGPVTVTTIGGTSNGVNFTVTSPPGPPPTITSIYPNVGSVEGGSNITITGSGFTSDTKVYFCQESVSSVAMVDASTLRIVTNPGVAGACDVLVSNINGDAFLPDGFTYLEGPPERVASINPTMGLTSIPINTPITILFARPVDKTTVNSASLSLVETSSATLVSGTFSFDFGDLAVIFRPDTYLKTNISYTLYIKRDIKSSDGIPLDKPFSGSFTTAGSADTVSPKVTVSPSNGATEVPVNTLIVFGFSEPINPTMINFSTITVMNNGTPKSGNVTIGQNNIIATFTPTSSFSPGSLVTVTLSKKVTDMAGNAIVGSNGVGTDFVSSFTTATTTDIVPPRVININPPDKSAGINANTTVSVTFSEPINPVTVNSGTFNILIGVNPYPGQITFSGQNSIATFTPNQPLPSNSLMTVTLGAGISDTAGNAMPLPFNSTFTTETGMDNYQPSVIEVSPYNGQTGVSLNSDITIAFDERINPISVNSANFYVTRDWWTVVPGTISISPNGLSATFSPSQPLLPNTYYYVFYTNGIKDIAGNPLYNPGYTGFMTGIELADTTAPEVIEISPKNGATGVPVNTEVLIKFSEAIDRTTVDGSTFIVSKGGVPVEGDLTVEQDSKVIRYKVAKLYNFDPNTFYQVTVTTEVTDTAGNPLTQEFTSGFTTGDAIDTVAPDVVSVVPAYGATDVSPDTTIEVTFTEAIDPVTVNASTFWVALGWWWGASVPGTYTVSPDRTKVTFTPDYPLFAGNGYYIHLANIEDLAGNRLPERWYYFTTAFTPGTDPNTLPASSTVVVNPSRLFADGTSTATVGVMNINRNGVLVPNGTKIAVSVAPVFTGSAGGTILGGVDCPSDSRFKIFTAIGGAVTFTYQSANLPDLTPGSVRYAYIQAASVDAGDRPVSNIGNGTVELVRGRSIQIDVNPQSLFANGSSYSEVSIKVFDQYSQPVPPGTKIGVTAEAVYHGDSLGGTISGGVVAPDSRFKIFSTVTGGIVNLTYTSPALAADQSGNAWIQVVDVDDTGRVVGLIGDRNISLSGSTGYTAPQPRVLSVSPENGQTNVSLSTPVIAEFSQPLDVSTVTNDNFRIPNPLSWWDSVPGVLTLSAGINGPNTIVTFTPNNPWSPNTAYTIYIGTGIKSQTGNPLLGYSYTSFSTGVILTDNVPPSVVMVNPPDGVTSAAINSTVSAEFSEPMDASTVNVSTFKLAHSGIEVSGRVEKVNSTIFRFIPDAMLIPNTTYQVSVASSVRDTAGNPMVSPFSSTFTTQTGMDNYRPSVVGVDPINGATDIPVTSSVTITFSEPMNILTRNTNTCYLTGPDSWWEMVPSTITFSAANTQVIVTPIQPLFAGRYYYIHISAGMTDMAGNALSSDFSSAFTTAIAAGTVDLPTGATVTVNPLSIFANGEISTTVIINNINRNGTLVPNGTIIGLTAPAFNQSSVGGIISGQSFGTSVDSRFLLFSTEGASVTVSYTPPELDWLMPGATAGGVIQVAAVDLDTRPVTLIAQGIATLFRIQTAGMTPGTSTLPADGTSQTTVDVIVRDNLGNLVPDGTEVGITVAPVFIMSSAGGTVLGGVQSATDQRVQIFSTIGGQFSFTYQAPSSVGLGYGAIQATTVNAQEAPTGLINVINIYLTIP